MLDLNDVMPIQPRERFDPDEIVHRLRDTAHLWAPQHFSNGRREGDEWRLANIRGDAPHKNGSCVIALKGERAGDWYDHDGGAGGGPLSTLEQATGFSGRELFAHAADVVGWTPAAPARREPPPPSKEKDSQREIAIILSRAAPIAGTPAETYLRARGIAVPRCDDLLFHPDLVHWETKAGWPALIGVVRSCKNGNRWCCRPRPARYSSSQTTIRPAPVCAPPRPSPASSTPKAARRRSASRRRPTRISTTC
jgi:putative DNA primase/helicase